MVFTERMQLMAGDCLERMQEIPDGSIDMILTDPPYGTTACKWDSIIPLEPMWAQLKRVIKPNGAIVMTASQPFTSILVSSNIANFKHEWIWEKNRGSNFANLKTNPFKEHESVVVFSRDRINFYPIRQPRSEGGKSRSKYAFTENSCRGGEAIGKAAGGHETFIEKETRNPSSVQKFNCEVGFHPTQKPVALMEYLIKTYTDPDETVLDFTMGSGTTGVAAMNLGRKFIGIELDPTYYGIACGRIAEAAGFREGTL